ncbi:hypothetical protein SARC_10061 [Sphaeroforma arctica JP610]|uniref:Inner membrane component domain-containing protein n=1 Tax=Sphaeroforma arctica JP610 TaxID=667725 RepID=A0A0L0FL13_9EUKA|nr:hypothetical protein SARC_10061 [Sphaeroforma arctica JP610]KNC77477.1 hypothetical protein SARC_10061 [Sphaeroforma arctica JP610]|eukprot:XP_014151379.1 hypothetical protein SARC_10061 [Sphaeroforma arctica JP610]
MTTASYKAAEANTRPYNYAGLYPEVEPSAPPADQADSSPAYQPPAYSTVTPNENYMQHQQRQDQSSSSSHYGAIYPPEATSTSQQPQHTTTEIPKHTPYNPRTPIITTVHSTRIHEDRGECTDLGNILWFIFGGGVVFFIIYALIGVLLCLTIVLFPFGLQLFKLAKLSAFAFGKTISRPDYKRDYCRCCANLLWLPIGLILGVLHMTFAVSMFMTIIGIPFAIQHVKLCALALWPFGSDVGYQQYHALSTETRVDYV